MTERSRIQDLKLSVMKDKNKDKTVMYLQAGAVIVALVTGIYLFKLLKKADLQSVK